MIPRPRGARIVGQPLSRQLPAWQEEEAEEEEDQPGPGPHEDMEEDQYNLEPPIPPEPDQEVLPAEENMDLDVDLEVGGNAEIAPPDQDGDQPVDCRPAGPLAEGAGQSEALVGHRPTTRSQTRASRKRVTFQCDPSVDQEFESACIRMKDVTIDMEPANLARMCVVLKPEAKLPYRQNKTEASAMSMLIRIFSCQQGQL